MRQPQQAQQGGHDQHDGETELLALYRAAAQPQRNTMLQAFRATARNYPNTEADQGATTP